MILTENKASNSYYFQREKLNGGQTFSNRSADSPKNCIIWCSLGVFTIGFIFSLLVTQ